MKRIKPILAVVFLTVALVGLLNGRSSHHEISAPSPRAELETQVGERVGVKNLSLAVNAIGEYAGNGMTADGRSIHVQANRKGTKIVWRATSWSAEGRTLEVGGGAIGVDARRKTSQPSKR
jgi:hypothetical protein